MTNAHTKPIDKVLSIGHPSAEDILRAVKHFADAWMFEHDPSGIVRDVRALIASSQAAVQPAPATGDERVAHGEAEVSTVAEVMAECEAFEAAMVEAGFSRPALGRYIGMYQYRRDGDRFTGWKLARAAHRRENQDTKRLDALRDESWDVRSFCIGDEDVGWRVVEFHMAAPHERVIAEVFKDDPRAAIDAAMQRTAAPAHGEQL